MSTPSKVIFRHPFTVQKKTIMETPKNWRRLTIEISSTLSEPYCGRRAENPKLLIDRLSLRGILPGLNFKNRIILKAIAGPWESIYNFRSLMVCLANSQKSVRELISHILI